MKSQEELFNMTVMELREYMNSLSNEEIKQAAEMFNSPILYITFGIIIHIPIYTLIIITLYTNIYVILQNYTYIYY